MSTKPPSSRDEISFLEFLCWYWPLTSLRLRIGNYAASLNEVERAKALCDEVEQELKEQQVEYRRPKIGIMIEPPAAAILSRDLAHHVDFFSVGTNDLTQYTTACDRQNQNLGEFFDPHHEAVLELLRQIALNAHAAGIPVGICGELAADPELTDTFVAMGYDELSVSPGAVLALRERICLSEAECQNDNPQVTATLTAQH